MPRQNQFRHQPEETEVETLLSAKRFANMSKVMMAKPFQLYWPITFVVHIGTQVTSYKLKTELLTVHLSSLISTDLAVLPYFDSVSSGPFSCIFLHPKDIKTLPLKASPSFHSQSGDLLANVCGFEGTNSPTFLFNLPNRYLSGSTFRPQWTMLCHPPGP